MPSRNHGYENLFPEEKICIYCGLPSEVLDHILPYAHRDNPLAASWYLAPACAECNGILSDSLQATVGDRIKEAKKRLRKRYKKLLAAPNWTMEELAEMSADFQSRIIKMGYDKKLVEERLQFDYFLWVKLGRDFGLLPVVK